MSKVITVQNVYTRATSDLCQTHYDAQAAGDVQVQHGLHAGQCNYCASERVAKIEEMRANGTLPVDDETEPPTAEQVAAAKSLEKSWAKTLKYCTACGWPEEAHRAPYAATHAYTEA